LTNILEKYANSTSLQKSDAQLTKEGKKLAKKQQK
jgi:hypothetical protein